jgi:hypothetical protein
MVHSNENITEGALSTDDEMTINEQRKYLRKMKKRYQESFAKEPSRLLDEMQAIADLY